MLACAFTPSAREDLLDIWFYTQERWGEAQADRYQDDLQGCCERIAAGSVRTRPVAGIPGVNAYHCRRHYIFFLQHRETIVVIAVFHERMDLINRLRDRL